MEHVYNSTPIAVNKKCSNDSSHKAWDHIVTLLKDLFSSFFVIEWFDAFNKHRVIGIEINDLFVLFLMCVEYKKRKKW